MKREREELKVFKKKSVVNDEAEGALPRVDDLLAGEEVVRNSRIDFVFLN